MDNLVYEEQLKKYSMKADFPAQRAFGEARMKRAAEDAAICACARRGAASEAAVRVALVEAREFGCVCLSRARASADDRRLRARSAARVGGRARGEEVERRRQGAEVYVWVVEEGRGEG
eukprot:6191424-Pleurochrysis_carterae.AAC.1